MVETQHHHRAVLKQQNKSFKSRHASKSSLKDRAKGKIERVPSKAAASSNAAAARTKLNRRNQARQVQAQKRSQLVSANRLFNGADGAPRIVVVVPLSPDVSSKNIVSSIAASIDISNEGYSENGIWKMRADRFKTSLQFRTLPYREFYATLDACKLADYVVFALSSTVEVDEWADTLLRSLQSQGLPEVVTVISPDSELDARQRTGIMKSLLSFIQYFVPSQDRVFDLHTPADQLNALRSISEGIPSNVRWRDGRSYLLSEKTEWEIGVLKVTGVLRGATFSANSLVHIPNFGDFQVEKVLSAPLPKTNKAIGATVDIEPTLLSVPDPEDADSLVSTNDPDDLESEQTWPTEEEMKGFHDQVQYHSIPDAVLGTTPKAVKRIPKGMSEYQAAWIIDEGEEEDAGENETSGSDNDSDAGLKDDEMEEMVDIPIEDTTDMATEKHVAFQDLDNEEEASQLEKWRNRKREEENENAFPDEIDTPQNTPARERFARYRGMKSLRTSPWDSYENLPRDYARIFQFEDFKRTERAVRRRAEQALSGVQPGTRVMMYLRDVPQGAANSTGLTVFSLFQHEHKFTTLNFSVQRNTEYDESVRSKDPLILCVGPRRLSVNPLYSQHTRGGGKGTNNVHKFERYLRHGNTSIATIYGPVTYGHQPCTLFREGKDPQAPHLVAYGSFLNTDTTRIIAKRITLSGHPFKVHKKTATIRYMFFNPDDIQYFKPIQLFTKYGRVGHIKESLGTHGYFKAYFDGPINQMDTVCMSLYKRVYPKWAKPACEAIGCQDNGVHEVEMDDVMMED